MDDSQRLAHALSRIEPAWDEPRTERAWRGLRRKRKRRAIARVAGASAAVALLALGGYRLLGGDDTASRPAPVANADSEPRLAPEAAGDIVIIHDGFTVTPEPDAAVDVTRPNADEVAVDVVRGVSRFRHRGERGKTRVALTAGRLAITVYASEFSVARYADVAEVWSHQGMTQVEWYGETISIAEGEHRRFDPADVPAPVLDDGADTDAPRPERPSAAGPDWRPLAREGKYDAAYRILRKTRHGDGAAELMLAADVYRMTGHPARAVAALERMVTRHREDPRAALAAFTLGRMLLDDLGRPAEAARAFAKARTFAPDGAMAEDALAREAEAWAKAGQAARARDRALLYLERHPNGHRARAVKQYGGL